MRTHLPLTILLLFMITCSSCSKISEDIKRDLIVTDSVDFEIPILSSINDTTKTTTGIGIALNLDSLNPDNTNNFSRENISKIRISSFRMVLLESDTSVLKTTNFSNIQFIKAELVAGGRGQNFANVTNTSTSLVRSYNLPVSIPEDTAKKYLINPDVTYTFRYKARKTTTIPMKSRAYATYTITLEK